MIEVIPKPVDWLSPHPRNSRTHTDDQIVAVSRAIETYGFTQPVVATPGGVILIGHGRVAAAKALGLAEVPVVVLAGLSDADERALIIADNRLAEVSFWDKDILGEELAWLLGEEFDITLTGWDMGEAKPVRPEAEAPAAGEPVTAPGDVWRLGKSLIACGSAGAVEAALAARSGDKRHPPTIGLLGPSALDSPAGEATLLAGCPVLYWWTDQDGAADAGDALAAAGYQTRAQIVAVRESVEAGGRWREQHAAAWYAVRRGATGHWRGLRDQTTVWRVEGRGLPLDCWRRPMLNHLAKGYGALLPDLGRAEALIAAASCGRAVYATEADPATVDRAVKRWEAYTGQTAFDAAGVSFRERATPSGE